MIDDLEARRARGPIDRGQVGQEIEGEHRFVAQRAQEVERALARDRDCLLAAGLSAATISAPKRSFN